MAINLDGESRCGAETKAVLALHQPLVMIGALFNPKIVEQASPQFECETNVGRMKSSFPNERCPFLYFTGRREMLDLQSSLLCLLETFFSALLPCRLKQFPLFLTVSLPVSLMASLVHHHFSFATTLRR
jgi:hypothetical protein